MIKTNKRSNDAEAVERWYQARQYDFIDIDLYRSETLAEDQRYEAILEFITQYNKTIK